MTSETSSPQSLALQLAPNSTAFIVTRLVSTIVSFFTLTIIALVLSIMIEPLIALSIILFAVVAAIRCLNAFIAYRKQRYSFSNTAIDYGDGSLFTNSDVTLSYKNITHVRLTKPFIEHGVFGTGTIIIESSGSQTATVTLKSIADPEQAFERIRNLLKKDTFQLTYADLLCQKKPSVVAAVLQFLGIYIIAIGSFTLSIGVGIIASLETDMSVYVLIIGFILTLAGGIATAVLTWLDQMRRTYSVYRDVIHYSKGFLTKQEAFIPAENLANTTMTQSFISKLFGVQDIVVSCQGASSDIRFTNIRNGEDMQSAIRKLVNKNKPSTAGSKPADTTRSTAAIDKFVGSPTPRDTIEGTHDFKMDMGRAMMSLIFLLPVAILIITLPVVIYLIIMQYIIVKRTSYRISPSGAASYYSFLSTKNVEFTRDKITGLVIKQNPFDRMFGTCSAEIWSIGSGESIVYRYIKCDDTMLALLKTQAGIIDDETLETVQPHFTFGRMVAAHVYAAVLHVLLLLTVVLVALIHSWWWLLIALFDITTLLIIGLVLLRRYSHAWLRLGQHTISSRIGIMFRQTHFTRVDSVKSITLKKYPFSALGTAYFNIAGERQASTNNGQKVMLPNMFSLAYLPGIDEQVSGQTIWLDSVLMKPDRTQYQTSAVSPIRRTSRPALSNSILLTSIIHVIAFPLLVILPISIIAQIIRLRHVHYYVDDVRTIVRYGVIYRKQASVLHTRLDYTETSQRALNKLCRNGMLLLYTAGNSRAELTLASLPDYMDFHQAIKRHYEK